MTTQDFETKTKELIDSLKGICANYGLGNDGNEFKIITQVFLYKFLNDKYTFETKRIDPKLAAAESWEQAIAALSTEELDLLELQLGADTARLKPKHFIAHLFNQQNASKFAKLFDDTLRDIAAINNDVFAVKTGEGTKITLFDRISEYIADETKRDSFCTAIINKLVNFSFERIFDEKHDFYATIFEYLIKDYNKDNGGTYAEYYTPHAVAKIMAAILVPQENRDSIVNASCYDPSAGSGTLLMNLAHAIGEERCVIYSQDISQKSSSLLRLNLILNNLVHSIPNIIQGNTLTSPHHRDGQNLKQFDFIVSNPPFKLDFSDFHKQLDAKENYARFFAGIPKIPPKDKDKMAIYQLFIQHIIHSLKPNGKAAIVVPTGFISAQSGIDLKIRQKLIENKMLAGIIIMPSEIFATTNTNVSILFIDASNKENVMLVDASNLGSKVSDNLSQKTILSKEEEHHIIKTFNSQIDIDGFSKIISYEKIAQKNYNLSSSQYLNVKKESEKLNSTEFSIDLEENVYNLNNLFKQSRNLELEIQKTVDNFLKKIATIFPKEFEESEFGQIPKGWKWVSLEKIVSFIQRGISPAYIDKSEILVLNQKCIRDHEIDFSKSRCHDDSKKVVKQERFIQIGDILINSTGKGTLGRLAQVTYIPESNVTVDSHITIIRPNTSLVLPRFLGYSLIYREDEIEKMGEGSTGQTELSRQRLMALEILLAPISFQKTIEEIAQVCEKKLINNHNQNSHLCVLRDILFPKLVSGQLQIPS